MVVNETVTFEAAWVTEVMVGAGACSTTCTTAAALATLVSALLMFTRYEPALVDWMPGRVN